MPLQLLIAAAVALQGHGNPACPCVDVHDRFAEQRDPSLGRLDCVLYSSGSGVAQAPGCLPTDYGSSGCAPYDLGVLGCNSTPAPSYCVGWRGSERHEHLVVAP